jgi:hypothetical protein
MTATGAEFVGKLPLVVVAFGVSEFRNGTCLLPSTATVIARSAI